jgi:hypothetical protein
MYYGITVKGIPSLAPHALPGDREDEEDNNHNHENTKKTPSTIEPMSSGSTAFAGGER